MFYPENNALKTTVPEVKADQHGNSFGDAEEL
jgi:hypothetical protein